MLKLDKCSYCNQILDHNNPDADIRSYMDKYQLCFGCTERMQQFIDENMNILIELYLHDESINILIELYIEQKKYGMDIGKR